MIYYNKIIITNMSKMLIVINPIDNKYSMKNQLVHNYQDIPKSVYLKLSQSIYQSIPVQDKISQGQISMSAILRTKNVYAFNDLINVEIHEPIKQVLRKIKFNVSKFKTPKTVRGRVSVHEDILIKSIKETFKDFYFAPNQTLIFEDIIDKENKQFLLDVNVDGTGYLDEKTEIILLSVDLEVNIMTSKILSKEFFDPNFDFTDMGIGGHTDKLKDAFTEAFSTRAISQNIIEQFGIKHAKGMLLHGPPGTGKTLIARNISGLISPNVPPKIVNGPEILHGLVGKTEENVRKLFEDAEKDYKANGKNADLHVIIIDEVDAICKERGKNGSGVMGNINDNIVNQLLSKIDGIEELPNIFLIIMTNKKYLLDKALLRSGRVDKDVEIGLPDFKGRVEIFKIHTKKIITNGKVSKDLDIDFLASRTQNFSGAEIAVTVKNAVSYAIKRNIQIKGNEEHIIVEQNDFLVALTKITPVFGASMNNIISNLPDHVIITEIYSGIYQDLLNYVKPKRRLTNVLIYGPSGSGKTVLTSKFALDVKIDYTKTMKPIDYMGFSEQEKINLLLETFRNAYIVENSLIILDDIDIFLEYSCFENNVMFSNKLFQALKAILKTLPDNRNNSVTVIATCSNKKISKFVIDSFNKYIEMFEFDKEMLSIIDNQVLDKIIDKNTLKYGNTFVIKQLMI